MITNYLVEHTFLNNDAKILSNVPCPTPLLKALEVIKNSDIVYFDDKIIEKERIVQIVNEIVNDYDSKRSCVQKIMDFIKSLFCIQTEWKTIQSDKNTIFNKKYETPESIRQTLLKDPDQLVENFKSLSVNIREKITVKLLAELAERKSPHIDEVLKLVDQNWRDSNIESAINSFVPDKKIEPIKILLAKMSNNEKLHTFLSKYYFSEHRTELAPLLKK